MKFNSPFQQKKFKCRNFKIEFTFKKKYKLNYVNK